MYNKIGNSALPHIILCLPLTLNIHSFVFLLYLIPDLCIFGKKTQTKYTSHFSEAVTESQKHYISTLKKSLLLHGQSVQMWRTPPVPTLVIKAGNLNIWPEIYRSPVPGSPFSHTNIGFQSCVPYVVLCAWKNCWLTAVSLVCCALIILFEAWAYEAPVRQMNGSSRLRFFSCTSCTLLLLTE